MRRARGQGRGGHADGAIGSAGIVAVLAILILLPSNLARGSGTVTVTGPSLTKALSDTAAWQEVASASVSTTASGYAFALTVNATVPSAPTLPGRASEVAWWFFVTTITNSSPEAWPHGFPHPAHEGDHSAFPATYMVQLVWNGVEFAGLLTNRTPLLAGANATVAPIAFTISGTTLTLNVTRAELGAPAHFWWAALVDDWSSGFYTISSPTNVTMRSGNLGYVFVQWTPQVGSGDCSGTYGSFGNLCFADSPA